MRDRTDFRLGGFGAGGAPFTGCAAVSSECLILGRIPRPRRGLRGAWLEAGRTPRSACPVFEPRVSRVEREAGAEETAAFS